MSADVARAFAPGHVSGIFAVHDEAEDPLAKGSRGVGWSLDRGATATVRAADTTTIALDGLPSEAPVTRTALARLTAEPLHVDISLDLPGGQGFGTSAAGTLAACLAATRLLDLEPEQALEAAHIAEVTHGTGLGDAIGSWNGSGELRIKPGCPPRGWAMRIEPPAGTRFLYCILGDALPTPSIIRDPAWKARTKAEGDAAVDRILAAGRDAAWPLLLEESAAFGHRLGLMPPALAELGAALPEGITWGQSMLGSTLWATGPADALDDARPLLAAAGTVVEAGIDASGARLVR
ncbi:MAG: pantoate kinase [Thermoplasmatota archaeon]